jgi:CelD/BcsL family acetyltransferase involved in cellulose biosynthesis
MSVLSPPLAEQRSAHTVSRSRIRELRSWEGLPELENAWNELLAGTAARTVFLTWEWIRSWWDSQGPGHELKLLFCTDAGGELMALVPLMRSREQILPGVSARLLRLIGDGFGGSENLDWIVRQGSERAVVGEVLDWLEQNAAEWDILALNTVPSSSPVASELRNQMTAREWRVVESETSGYILQLPSTWDICLHSLSKNMRSQLSYRARRLQAHFQIRLRRCDSVRELPDCLEQFFSLHTKRWESRGQTGSLYSPQKRRFYAEVATRLLARGWLDFWLLELDGKPAAAEFGMTYAGTYSFLQAGFDPNYAAYSVGRVLRAMIMQELIRRRVRAYDFLGGDDPYKARWGAYRLGYLHMACARPFSKGASALLVAQSAQRSKDWLRAHIPEKLWCLLREFYRRLRAS